jgi:hypothetical protein
VAAEERVHTMKTAIAAAQATLAAAVIEPEGEPGDEPGDRPTVVAEAEADDHAAPTDGVETVGTNGDALLAAMTDSELAALDRLVVMKGHLDRASLVRDLCLRALTGAGLLGVASGADRGNGDQAESGQGGAFVT